MRNCERDKTGICPLAEKSNLAFLGKSPTSGSQLDRGMELWVRAMRDRCIEQQKKHTHIQISWARKRNSKPPYFPKGELVAEYDKVNAYAYECSKVIAWCDDVLSYANEKDQRKESDTNFSYILLFNSK